MKLRSSKRKRQPLRSRAVAPPPSAYSGSRNEQTPRSRQRQVDAVEARARVGQRSLLQRLGLGLLLVAIIIGVIASLRLNSAVSVKVLTTSTGSQHILQSSSVYAQTATAALKTSVWNHTKLTANTDAVAQQLQRKYPELAGVSLTVSLFGSRPTVYLVPAQPALLIAARNGTFLLDTSGKALLRSENAAGLDSLSLPTVADQSNIDVTINHTALSSPDVSFVQIITGQLAAKSFQTSSLSLPPGARELDVAIAGQPYIGKFNLFDAKTARQQAGAFLATQAQLTNQHITPAHYIDVRVQGRAYYQ